MRKLGYLVVLLALVFALVPVANAQDGNMMGGTDVIVTLSPTDFAEGAGLGSVTGWAHVVSDEGHVHIVLEPNGAALPDGSVLEGWVVDAGLNGGPGDTNASDADEAFGTPFDNADFDAAVEAAPYALSTGVLTATETGTWEVKFDIPAYNFSPYDAVVVTLESDGDDPMGFDPRPGTPVFAGATAEGEPAEEAMMSSADNMMGGDNMMMEGAIEVVLEPTPYAEGAGLAGVTGTALVYVDSGTIEIALQLNGATVPEGSVLEGWVVDAGLDGGPGTTNVSDADETFGTPFGSADFGALVDSAPYAFSTGVAYDNMDGTLSLTFHVPAYNFSPYDAVVITLESDGDTTAGFDPRPGAPVFAGAIVAGDGM
jgi:hypothetical protein